MTSRHRRLILNEMTFDQAEAKLATMPLLSAINRLLIAIQLKRLDIPNPAHVKDMEAARSELRIFNRRLAAIVAHSNRTPLQSEAQPRRTEEIDALLLATDGPDEDRLMNYLRCLRILVENHTLEVANWLRVAPWEGGDYEADACPRDVDLLR